MHKLVVDRRCGRLIFPPACDDLVPEAFSEYGFQVESTTEDTPPKGFLIRCGQESVGIRGCSEDQSRRELDTRQEPTRLITIDRVCINAVSIKVPFKIYGRDCLDVVDFRAEVSVWSYQILSLNGPSMSREL